MCDFDNDFDDGDFMDEDSSDDEIMDDGLSGDEQEPDDFTARNAFFVGSIVACSMMFRTQRSDNHTCGDQFSRIHQVVLSFSGPPDVALMNGYLKRYQTGNAVRFTLTFSTSAYRLSIHLMVFTSLILHKYLCMADKFWWRKWGSYLSPFLIISSIPFAQA